MKAEERRPLADLVVKLQRGQSYKSAQIGAPGPFLLGLGTIHRHGGFRDENLRTYGGDTPDNILLAPGDLYLSLKDMTHAAELLGAVSRVPKGIYGRLTQDTIKLEADEGRIDQNYLYWVLRDPRYRDYCRMRGTGTTNLDLSRSDFLAYDVYLPPKGEQRAIAEVLGALDDKIAANTRLVDTALQLAGAHFIRVAFEAPLSDMTFADVADIGGGGTPKTKVEEYWGDEIDWSTPTDVTALHGPYLSSTSRRITQAGLDNCSSALYPTGSILMTSRATIGAFAVAQSPVAVNQGFIVVNSKGDVPQWWLFHEMQRRVPEFVSHANGATFLELSRGKFKNFHVHLAAAEAMQRFDETAGALHNRAAAAETESASLAATRDALLPLLMSGKVTVKDAEAVVEEAV